MNRRSFLKSTGIIAAGAMAGAVAPAAAAAAKSPRCKHSKDEEYSIVILGDTHYDGDPASVYHEHFVPASPEDAQNKRYEFNRNGEMWKTLCPRLLERASRLVRPDTKMVFQMGDLIQGDCGDPEVHKKMLGDALDLIKGSFGTLPFVTVTGNHDIRGVGAEKVYHEYMPQRMSKELGKNLSGVNFSFRIGPDAFIFIDFNKPEDAVIEQMLEDTKDARHTFIVSHAPIFPYDSRSNPRWIFHGGNNPADNEARKHFRYLLAERNAICLCGHVHTTEIADWWGDGGRITQMTMNSVWKSEEAGEYIPGFLGSAHYGDIFAREVAEGRKSESDIARCGDIFEEYRPGLQRYLRAQGAGCYRLVVGADRITIEFYSGDSEHLIEGFLLR